MISEEWKKIYNIQQAEIFWLSCLINNKNMVEENLLLWKEEYGSIHSLFYDIFPKGDIDHTIDEEFSSHTSGILQQLDISYIHLFTSHGLVFSHLFHHINKSISCENIEQLHYFYPLWLQNKDKDKESTKYYLKHPIFQSILRKKQQSFLYLLPQLEKKILVDSIIWAFIVSFPFEQNLIFIAFEKGHLDIVDDCKNRLCLRYDGLGPIDMFIPFNSLNGVESNQRILDELNILDDKMKNLILHQKLLEKNTAEKTIQEIKKI